MVEGFTFLEVEESHFKGFEVEIIDEEVIIAIFTFLKGSLEKINQLEMAGETIADRFQGEKFQKIQINTKANLKNLSNLQQRNSLCDQNMQMLREKLNKILIHFLQTKQPSLM